MALMLPILTIAVVGAALSGQPYGITDDFLFERYINAPLEDSTGPFGEKDVIAAQLTHRSREEYVIGGMEKSFRDHIANLLHALDDAGLRTCINSGYRGPERQRLIIQGMRASPNSSYHGGGPSNQGYGRGIAADLVSCFGTTQDERNILSQPIYAWIDVHGGEFNIGRPYGDRDAGHVGPRDGKEYAANHSEGHTRMARGRYRHLKTRVAHEHSTKRRVASS